MRKTINRDRIGTTEYQADVQYLIPTDDSTVPGNRGLIGYDEDTKSRTFKTRAGAERWALRWKPETGESDYLQINEIQWDADDIEDETYGLILDASMSTVRSWFWDHAAKKWEVLG